MLSSPNPAQGHVIVPRTMILPKVTSMVETCIALVARAAGQVIPHPIVIHSLIAGKGITACVRQGLSLPAPAPTVVVMTMTAQKQRAIRFHVILCPIEAVVYHAQEM